MRSLRGVTIILMMAVNLFLWGTPVMLGGLVRFVFDRTRFRSRIVKGTSWFAERWVAGNNWIFRLMLPTQWDVEGVEDMSYDRHYLIVSNHISWVDIFVLFRIFHGHAAVLRFFLKQVLIWVPIAGQACWALDFPFMKRYSPEYLAKHPEKRGADLETTRRACRRYRDIPVAILNFMEGTRFSKEKHAESPYRHLLRPRVGGIAFVFASLGEQLDAFLDATIAYPGHEVTFWQFVTGRVPRISVNVRRIPVPPEFLSESVIQPGTVREFKQWIEKLWSEKDELLDGMLRA
ncbi:MAG: acyltransferase [Acidobacteria bacterium]|nr:acyltransferase [Acidobacteriota bacterium]